MGLGQRGVPAVGFSRSSAVLDSRAAAFVDEGFLSRWRG